MWRTAILAAVSVVLALPIAAESATLPANFTEALVVDGLDAPTAMALAPDGRLFVATQEGELRVVNGDVLLPTPFLTLDTDPTQERGLSGVTFDPDFATNGFVYVYYTAPETKLEPARNRVSRFTADPANPDVAAPGSEVEILNLDDLTSASHNGGAIHFGTDGKLYVAVGDDTSAENAQTCGNRFGKLLRINADGTIPDNAVPPACQASPPTGANTAIWAMGLRNPFKFAVQPVTGRLFINDVGSFGADPREEINDGVEGANYGWPAFEGASNDPGFVDPLFDFGHEDGACAITGGAFYNPATPTFPAEYVDDYFFADLCAGWIRRYDIASDAATDFASGLAYVIDVAVADDGSLYYLQRYGDPTQGAVYRITYSAPTAVAAHSFTARRTARGVVLRWRTGDPRVLGFHVYRGGRRLDRTLIRGQAFVDGQAAGAGRLRYRLEAVLGDGSRRVVASISL